MLFARYGIFYTPPTGPFAQTGAAWLGWDAATGETPEPPTIGALPLSRDDITATPRRYGLHATVKPPFRLAPGHCPDDLQDALRTHCAALAPVQLAGLKLAPLGRFLALVPDGETGDLAALAASTVRDLDRFRDAPTEDELARRRASGLTPAQDAMLLRWGYPYVLDEFRFHITLTGKMPKPALTKVAAVLQDYLLPHVPSPLTIDALSLMGEDRSGRFHLIHRYALSG
ncbi:MAG: DUF1045 domain-containing protein [Pseudomonadota bacterium]